jgi:DNA-directed RNA polymerase III subunit RPC3
LLVERRLGQKAAGLVAMVLQIGHCTVGDLAGVFEFDENGASKVDTPAQNGNGVSGAHRATERDPQQVGSLAELHHILRKLLRAGFLLKLGEHMFKPDADIEDELGAIAMEENFPDGKISGPKKQAEFKRSVDNMKRKRRDDSEYSERRDVDGNAGMIRPGMDANKRQKLNGGFANGHSNPSAETDFSGPRLPV